MGNVTVNDATLPSCDNFFAALAAGANETYACLSPALADDTTNVADVVGTQPDGSVVSDSATETVTVLVPGLEITKGPDTQTVVEGDSATFTITVTNTGQVDLTDVVVTDPATTDCDRTFAALVAGAFETYSCTAVGVEVGFVNVATVTGQSPGGPLTDQDVAEVIVTPTGDLVGRVFEDVNNNGVFDPLADLPIPNVDVVLTLADGSTLIVESGPDGTWSVVVPIGATIVDVNESDPDFPPEFSETTTTDGQTVNVANTGTTVSEPIGYTDLPGARLIGTVWQDVDRNGVFDAGEVGVGGITVNLLDSAGMVIATTTTDASGNYSFDELDPGTYSVEIVAPASTELTDEGVGDEATDSDVSVATGLSQQVTLADGDVGDLDAGLTPGLPVLTLDKRVTAGPTDQGSRQFALTYTLVVGNDGNGPLNELQLVDDLDATFATATGWTLGDVELTSGSCSLATSFDGDGATNLFVGTDTLAVGQSCTVTIDVVVQAGSAAGSFTNTAQATGVDVEASTLTSADTAAVSVPAPTSTGVVVPAPVFELPRITTAPPVPGTPDPVPSQPVQEPLAFTGAESTALVSAAMVLFLAGGALVIVRRRNEQDEG